MKLSRIGRLLASDTAIVQLMDDLGQALNDNPDCLFLGGGNPAQVPATAAVFNGHLAQLLEGPPHQHLGIYQSPQGNLDVRVSVSRYLRETCAWPVGPEHLVLVNGSQTAFFLLFNLFCGEQYKVMLPMVPEYLGYSAQLLAADGFVPVMAKRHQTASNRFKYQVDFENIRFQQAVNLMCLSSPSNPSGNVVSSEELHQLVTLAQRQAIPLVLDYAYGRPFPGLVYGDQKPFWQSGCIAVLSLSKLGLPGVRTSVLVADPELAAWVARANTNISLAAGNLGANLLKMLVDSGDMKRLSSADLPAFYRPQRDCLVALLDRHLRPYAYALHEPEGAFFIWLWLPELPITATELYQRLKKRGVIVMPGEHFFFGLDDPHGHTTRCLRLSYCQPPEVLEQAVRLLAAELQSLFSP